MEKSPELKPSDTLKRRLLKESVVIVLWVFSILIFLSIVSYYPLDPGFFGKTYGNFSKIPKNFVGNFGAYISDLLIGLFGFASLIIPPFLFHLGFRILYEKSLYKVISYLFLLISSSSLLSFIFGDVRSFFWGLESEVNAGGVIGIMILAFFVNIFGSFGAFIILSLIFLIPLSIIFEFSIVDKFKVIPEKIRYLIEKRRLLKGREKKLKETRETERAIKRIFIEKEEKEKDEKESYIIKKREDEEKISKLPLETFEEESDYKLPRTDLLDEIPPKVDYDHRELSSLAKLIEEKLMEFDIPGEVVEIHLGPVVTVFEFKPAAGVKFSRIVQLSEDLAIRLKREHIRIDRMGNKPTIGIEVPNEKREIISLREVLESDEYIKNPSKLPLALGKMVDGRPYVISLTELPHLLIAGTTGSGKSVGLNAIISSILFRAKPDEVKFIMIDPKQVELKIYEGIPHLLTPVVTDVKKAANALSWALKEMNERYKLFASVQVRSIEQFNRFVKTLTPNGYEGNIEDIKPKPYIVIVIDELYDLMAVVQKEVETAIARLSSMARAVGIHLVIATQRPSRDVITGVIKSNLPARIAFQVREKIESRLILDQNGAEKLEGRGDMLFLPPGSSRVIRIHGSFISTVETQRLIKYISEQVKPEYENQVLRNSTGPLLNEEIEEDEYEDPLFKEAVKLVVSTKIATATNLQRKLRLGYARAARLLDMMEERGIVGPVNGAKPREILISEEEIKKWLMED